MPLVEVRTLIRAPIENCFDLARDVRVHERTAAATSERVVETTRDLLELGDQVTFEARHFGIRQRLTSRIVACDRPHQFTDEMQRGAFKRLSHNHRFEATDAGTEMTDLLDLESPFGILGRVVDALILRRYMRSFLIKRGDELKRIAEANSLQ
jgi:ligand-binding SRPBCC domain-containing protein